MSIFEYNSVAIMNVNKLFFLLTLYCAALYARAEFVTPQNLYGDGLTANQIIEYFKPDNHIVLDFDFVDDNLLIQTTQGQYQRIGANQYVRTDRILAFPSKLSLESVSVEDGALRITKLPKIKMTYNGSSVRYNDTAYVATYSGVMHNKKHLPNINHCSGAIRTFKDTTYICWDGLSVYYRDSLIESFSGKLIGNFELNRRDYGRLGDILIENQNWICFTTKGVFKYNKRTQLVDTLYDLGIEEEVPYSPFLNNSKDVGYNKSWLNYHADGSIEVVHSFDSNILNISRNVKTIITTLDGLYLYHFNTRSSEMFLQGSFHNSTWVNNNVLLATSNHGLFRIAADTKSIDTLIYNEFNQNSLAIIEDSIYAGSVNGLLKMNLESFLKQEKMSTINISTKPQNKFNLILVMASLVSGALITQGLKSLISRKRTITSTSKKEDVTKVLVEDFIYRNIRTVTIDGLKSHFKLSQNALYEVCAPTSPGTIIRDERMRIVEDLLKTNATLSLLVERSGFSKTYLKRTVIPELIKRNLNAPTSP